MRKYSIFLLSLLLLGTTSCSYRQFTGVTAGSSLGGMFGSSIGGLMGGPRGSDKGTLAGMIIGGAVGAAVTADHSQKSSTSTQPASRRNYDETDAYNRRGTGGETGVDDVYYDTYNRSNYQAPAAAQSDLTYIEVTNVHFLDANNNQRLDKGEEAYLVMDIYNRGDRTLYNVAPQITSSAGKRVAVSPVSAISSLTSGQGVRYKAAVKALRRLSDQYITFSVSFGTGKQTVTAKQFRIQTGE